MLILSRDLKCHLWCREFRDPSFLVFGQRSFYFKNLSPLIVLEKNRRDFVCLYESKEKIELLFSFIQTIQHKTTNSQTWIIFRNNTKNIDSAQFYNKTNFFVPQKNKSNTFKTPPNRLPYYNSFGRCYESILIRFN